tara:strand:- start:123 stop:524 length:402 start_codon:yes stop_codon:yes gene_type:complete
MDSSENNSSSDISILDLQKQEKEKEQKKKNAERMRKYNSKPGVKEQKYVKRQQERMIREFKNMGKINPHKICKKLGSKSMRAISSTGARSFKCRTCSVTYTEKQKKYFYKNNHCPCCHLKLSTRKTVSEKRKQ